MNKGGGRDNSITQTYFFSLPYEDSFFYYTFVDGQYKAISINAYKGVSCSPVAFRQPSTSTFVTAVITGSNEFRNSFTFFGESVAKVIYDNICIN